MLSAKKGPHKKLIAQVEPVRVHLGDRFIPPEYLQYAICTKVNKNYVEYQHKCLLLRICVSCIDFAVRD